ncbi:MAG: transglycosylase domain-containing protein [Acidobacteriota bacterium]
MFTEPVEKFTFQLRSLWTQISNGGLLLGGRITGYRQRLIVRRPPNWMFWALLGTTLVLGVFYEVETSTLQSHVFSYTVRKMTYSIEPGPSQSVVFPKDGPLNLRRGYTRIGEFQERLENQGYRVEEQARFSPYLAKLMEWGIAPPYRDPGLAGLEIKSAEGAVLHSAIDRDQEFESYEEIPPLVAKALLLIENRKLAVESAYPTNNPVVEWNRMAKASLTYAGNKLGLPVRLEGGSTLATQLEKYLHSPDGRTESPGDKIKQIISASLKAYRDGANTSNARRRILIDYLNTMPLAAAPGFGEINGLGQGLEAWFGMDLKHTAAILRSEEDTPQKAAAFKHVLTLLAAVRAPGYYLLQDRAALEQRARYYARLLAEFGLTTQEFSEEVREAKVSFLPAARFGSTGFSPRQKLSSALRNDLAALLGVGDFYSLNRLDLEVRTSVDAMLQQRVDELFAKLKDPQFLDKHGLIAERLLLTGDPADVIYSLVLFESTPDGNVLRIQTDTLDRPLDVNEGIKMELGSTAKLRTLAHYLEVVASLYYERHRLSNPQDPITAFVVQAFKEDPGISLEELLQKSLDRDYSASPGEVFFTGGGAHVFGNFDPDDNGRRMSIREATRRSTNLVFIRLMRDLVRFHQARLPYDPQVILSRPENPTRQRMLKEIADSESRSALWHAFRSFQGADKRQIMSRLLGSRATNPRHLAILFFAWTGTAHADTQNDLAQWLELYGAKVKPDEVAKLARAYSNPDLTLADYGYLLGCHPLKVFVAGELSKRRLNWDELLSKSGPACEVSTSWLFKSRNRRAQDLRLRIRIEQDAFARMTPYWRRLGFPFEHLVPSYATAIGNSSDRPAALAELMGIILNDGELRPTLRFRELRFGPRTPYRTVIVPAAGQSQRVMIPAVSRVLRGVLADVVDGGTARRIAGVFKEQDGRKIVVGGKTGSGDNRLKSFARGGAVIGSRAVNRTATFAFYIGDRYFGVITACVLGSEAGNYGFTSALPVEILKNLAPAIALRYNEKKL